MRHDVGACNSGGAMRDYSEPVHRGPRVSVQPGRHQDAAEGDRGGRGQGHSAVAVADPDSPPSEGFFDFYHFTLPYLRVRTVCTDTGESWNLKVTFFRPGKSWNQAKVMENHGNANSWCDKFFDDLSVKNFGPTGNLQFATHLHLLQRVC